MIPKHGFVIVFKGRLSDINLFLVDRAKNSKDTWARELRFAKVFTTRPEAELYLFVYRGTGANIRPISEFNQTPPETA